MCIDIYFSAQEGKDDFQRTAKQDNTNRQGTKRG